MASNVFTAVRTSRTATRSESYSRLASAYARQPQSLVASLAALALCIATGAHAAPIGDVRLPPGFRAELVYSVPLPSQGSWVCLAVDSRGRLYASDQNGALYRIEPSPLGSDSSRTKVESIPMSIGMAQGLLPVGDKLYVVMNGQLGAFASGLYRLSDEDGDDRFDRLEQLRIFQGSGEHGPHAVVLGPDGKSLYVTAGNFTRPPLYDRSLVPPRWAEDQVLPRLYDPLGHATEIQPPGGWVARMDMNGKNLEFFSAGYRNAYDMAFNADGELLIFDSDMEWDIGAPWYRPTRICHVTSGSDYGWRNGNGPWPPYYPDTLPPAVEVGPGSPTGVTFGAGSKFPPRYQQALFAGDWSYGNIYAIHLAPHGASYRGEVERFASAMPMAVTDMVVRPQDGALYFTVGGRQSESAIYRIVWAGDAAAAEPPTSPAAGESVPPLPADEPALAAPAEARELRRKLEALHAGPTPGAVDQAWPQLANPDRFIRYAARVAVEQQPVDEWIDRALAEPNESARIEALLAVARSAAPDVQSRWVDSLTAIAFESADSPRRLALLRAASLGVIRFQPLTQTTHDKLLAAYDAHYPTGDRLVDRELANLLVRLEAPNIIARLLAVLDLAATQEEAIDAVVALSASSGPWKLEERTQLLDRFDRIANLGGGRSYFGYIVGARNRFLGNIPPAERQALAERLARPFVENNSPIKTQPRPFVREWTLDELTAAAENDAGSRDLAAGRRMFSAATCFNCHRVAGEGSSVGPDLTGVGRRFGVRDILRAIVEPDHEVSDQYQQMVFETNGRVIVGRVTNLSQDQVMVSTNMLDPKTEITIPRNEIDEQYPSETSIMPAGLLNSLTEAEVLDLLAYLRNGGADSPAPAADAERAGAARPPASATPASAASTPPPAASP